MSITKVVQSAVIPQPLNTLWSRVITMDFAWWDIVARAEFEGSPQTINAIVKLHFKDGAVWTVRIVTLSTESKLVEFEVVDTSPAYACASALHSIRLYDVTLTKQTFVQWSTEFSSDVTPAVIEDSKHKKLEAFEALIRSS